MVYGLLPAVRLGCTLANSTCARRAQAALARADTTPCACCGTSQNKRSAMRRVAYSASARPARVTLTPGARYYGPWSIPAFARRGTGCTGDGGSAAACHGRPVAAPRAGGMRRSSAARGGARLHDMRQKPVPPSSRVLAMILLTCLPGAPAQRSGRRWRARTPSQSCPPATAARARGTRPGARSMRAAPR
jgi:hypothetical protein